MKAGVESDEAGKENQQVAPELIELRRQFEEILQQTDELIRGLGEEQFNWRPEPGRWSIAECFDHLNVTAGLYLPLIEAAIERAKAAGLYGRGPFRRTLFGRLFLRATEPPPKVKLKAPKSFRPSPDKRTSDVVPAFAAAQRRYLQSVSAASGLRLSKIKVNSPASPLIRLTLEEAIALMAAHERRHLWQARQVRNHPDFPR
jgi:hypothetical protein